VSPARRQERRRVPIGPVVAALAGAVAIAAALVAVSVLGSGDAAGEKAPEAVAPQVERNPLFRGIPQDGIALGSAAAPVTLVEFADVQCPYCAMWARDTLPTIVDEYVRAGHVRVVFRGLSFVGPDSETALRAALAAGEQDRLWDVLHGLFLHQGAENAGWVTDDLLQSFAGAGVDTKQMLDGTRSPWVERQLEEARTAANAAQVPGTPFFQVGPTGGTLRRLEAGTLAPDTFRRAFDDLLAA
jgi:protein-disulfide isomerase